MPATSESTLTYAPKSGIQRTLETDLQQEYAVAANSHILPPWAKKVLDDAARGREFDVWIFYQALMQAMSAATTRDGASPARRLRARKIRHLAYWAAAIIEKTLTGAEPVEGPTSPALQAARDQLDAANAMVYEAANKLDLANERIGALIREKTELEAALENRKACEKSIMDNLVATDEAWHRAERKVKRLTTVLRYALSLLPDEGKFKVVGYRDRVNEER